MILINRKSAEVIGLTGSGRKIEMVSVKKTVLYFSRSFCVTNKLKAGQFMHFFNEGKTWRFVVNNDPDGFPLMKDSKENGALSIFSAALTHLIRRSTGKLGTVSFPIELTTLEQGGNKMYMILTDKPVQKRA